MYMQGKLEKTIEKLASQSDIKKEDIRFIINHWDDIPCNRRWMLRRRLKNRRNSCKTL